MFQCHRARKIYRSFYKFLCSSSEYLCSFFKYTYLTVLFICFFFSKFEKYFCHIFHNNFLWLIRYEVFNRNSWCIFFKCPFQVFINSVTTPIVMFTKFTNCFYSKEKTVWNTCNFFASVSFISLVGKNCIIVNPRKHSSSRRLQRNNFSPSKKNALQARLEDVFGRCLVNMS